MSPERAELAQLYRRAGFGARPDALDVAMTIGYDAAVERLLNPGAPDAGAAATPLPRLPPELPAPSRKSSPAEIALFLTELRRQLGVITVWWLTRMVHVQHPLVEKLTLLWHGHWATSVSGVLSAPMMLAQNETLRRHSLGDFRDLARAMVTDPALLIWLDAEQNDKSQPNENLSRELMELFVLGIGNYTESDVQEGARALTGWRVNRSAGRSVFAPTLHDGRPKTVLGRTDSFNSQSLVDLLVSQPASSTFVVTRLWRGLGSTAEMPAQVLGRLLAAYGADRNVARLVRAMLLDPHFRSTAVRHGQVKAPVEYVVGALRALRVAPAAEMVAFLPLLGQVPFRPPSVGGWPSGESWLTTSAAQARLQFAGWVVARADLGAVEQLPPAARIDAVAHLLSVDEWSPRTRKALAKASVNSPQLVALALISPEYVVN